MIRFATLGAHQVTQSDILSSQSRIFESQMQISSGKISRDYVGVAIDARRLVNLENSMLKAEGFIKNIDVVDGRLETMESSIANAIDLASRFRTMLVNALSLDNASLMAFNQQSENLLTELSGLLNAKQDNRYLFSGNQIGIPPFNESILLNDNVLLVDAAEYSGNATTTGAGITSITGISKVQIDSGSIDDAFQITYDNVSKYLKITNLNGGATQSILISATPAPGKTQDITFSVGNERVIVTIDDKFNGAVPIVTDTIVGTVDTSGTGLGAFGAISITGTTGDISKIDHRTIETSGTAAAATLTLSSTDGNFIASNVNLNAINPTLTVTFTNPVTGATIVMTMDVATALNDAAIADPDTEIRLDNFLLNVAATDGTVNTKDARPGDAGYDKTNPSYYSGNNAKLNVRIDEHQVIEYGITADNPGLEKLARALYLARTADVTAGNLDRAQLDEALQLAIESITEISAIRSHIGSDRKIFDQTKFRHSDFLVFTGEAVNKIEGVDIASAVAMLAAETTQLEASYMLTARLSQLTLVNFLR